MCGSPSRPPACPRARGVGRAGKGFERGERPRSRRRAAQFSRRARSLWARARLRRAAASATPLSSSGRRSAGASALCPAAVTSAGARATAPGVFRALIWYVIAARWVSALRTRALPRGCGNFERRKDANKKRRCATARLRLRKVEEIRPMCPLIAAEIYGAAAWLCGGMD